MFPLPGTKPSTKNSIIFLLSQQNPLTAKQIHAHLSTQGIRQSYQATHKNLQELLHENVIEKLNQNYSLKKEYIQQLSKLTQPAQNQLKPNTECTVIRFDTAMELAQFIMHAVCAQPNPEQKPSVSFFYHMWPPVSLSNADYAKFREIIASPKLFVCCHSTTAFDKMCAQTFIKNGAEIRFGMDLMKGKDFCLYADYLLEVYFDSRMYEQWDKAYARIQKLDG
ncbi:MAG: hypothetical protein HY917_02260, partial [Candidatus Diapherotrites archaeon]|nr:hypothetical protein [Candidatus Diapherotrites archaeon]